MQMAAWRRYGTEDHVAGLYKRLAYACRYGRAGLLDAMVCDTVTLQRFCNAVAEIVDEENEASAGTRRGRT